MANWFETVTKTLADDKISRRTALRRVGGTVAGVAAASALPGLALAKKNSCAGGGGTCSNPSRFTNCQGNPNTNCYCFTELGGKAVCGCNSYCSQVPTCSSSQKCPKGSVCIVSTGCNCSSSQGVCVPACKKKNKNCQLGSGHGSTAAR
ncbi:MAG TPA: hypothetical protein VFA09_23710 [Ktedonobacteraceae bacterium]|nr:hypothetical protein [Ktedonobacteraceae bacterium]